jgi:hypothetical protein
MWVSSIKFSDKLFIYFSVLTFSFYSNLLWRYSSCWSTWHWKSIFVLKRVSIREYNKWFVWLAVFFRLDALYDISVCIDLSLLIKLLFINGNLLSKTILFLSKFVSSNFLIFKCNDFILSFWFFISLSYWFDMISTFFL